MSEVIEEADGNPQSGSRSTCRESNSGLANYGADGTATPQNFGCQLAYVTSVFCFQISVKAHYQSFLADAHPKIFYTHITTVQRLFLQGSDPVQPCFVFIFVSY